VTAVRALAFVAGLALATGCRFTGPASALRPVRRDSTVTWRVCNPDERCASEARLSYLGVGGFIIRAGDEAVMTAPSFTHPGIVAVSTPLWPIHSDSAAVDRELRRFLGDSLTALRGVHSILVGHSHYDHLMDVPLLARRFLPTAKIYGSLSTKRTLMGDSTLRSQAERIDSLWPADSTIGTPWHVGRWIYSPSRRMRFMALRSTHAANWLFFTLAPCRVKRDRTSLPRTGWGWCRGEPLSYLIDLLDESGRPALRIFYQDAAAKPMNVLLPPFVGADQRAVDIAIVCAPNFNKVPDYPTLLFASMRPKYVIVGHWEDFFHRQGDEPTPVRLTDTRELAARLDYLGPGRWVTPVPGGQIRVEY
jgi:hypothetical protein